MPFRAAALTIFLFVLAAPAEADTLVLKDGRTFEGQVSETGDSVGVITGEGVKMFPRSEVERIDRDLLNSVSPELRAAFIATRRRAMAQDLVAEAIAVWQQYADANPQGPLLPLAREELEALGRADAQGLVLWAGKLVTPQDRDAARHEAHELIDAAIALCDLARFDEARKKLIMADRLWPDHTTVDFYMATALRELRRPAEAANRFADVFAVLPEHVPSLNNAACLCAQMTDYLSAAKFLARAVKRDPHNDTLADNAWEILHGLEMDKSGPVLRLDFFKVSKDDIRALSEACAAHQRRRAEADGAVRWGSKWITKSQHDGYVTRQQATDRRLGELETEARILGAEIAELSSRIAVLDKMRDQALRMQNVQGALVLQRQIRRHQEQVGELQQKVAELSREAADLRKNRPEPAWTLHLTLMGIDSPLDRVTGGDPIDDETLRKAILGGNAVLLGHDGAPLGRVAADAHDPRSIWNPLGVHGSPWSKQSIFDATGPFGDPKSDAGPWNPSASRPPKVVLDGGLVCYLTANPSLSPRVTVESLVDVLRNAKPPPKPADPRP